MYSTEPSTLAVPSRRGTERPTSRSVRTVGESEVSGGGATGAVGGVMDSALTRGASGGRAGGGAATVPQNDFALVCGSAANVRQRFHVRGRRVGGRGEDRRPCGIADKGALCAGDPHRPGYGGGDGGARLGGS